MPEPVGRKPARHRITCESCHGAMDACYNAAEGGKVRAWYCPHCHAVSPAIHRERELQHPSFAAKT